jgi:transcriptional regulator with XRE-family HTH domain
MIGMNYDKENLEKLAENIRNQRKYLNLSQEKLAEKCDFDRTYISLLERSKRNITFLNLKKLSLGLEMSLSDLLKGI